jgi:hypothetical protein
MATVNALTNFGENTLTNYLVTGSGQKYLAIFSTVVAEDGTGTELSGAWYSRKAINFGSAVNGTAANSANIDFGEVTGAAANVVGWALFDAATGGNAWVYGAFEVAKTASVGTNVLIQAGDITVTGN